MTIKKICAGILFCCGLVVLPGFFQADKGPPPEATIVPVFVFGMIIYAWFAVTMLVKIDVLANRKPKTLGSVSVALWILMVLAAWTFKTPQGPGLSGITYYSLLIFLLASPYFDLIAPRLPAPKKAAE